MGGRPALGCWGTAPGDFIHRSWPCPGWSLLPEGFEPLLAHSLAARRQTRLQLASEILAHSALLRPRPPQRHNLLMVPSPCSSRVLGARAPSVRYSCMWLPRAAAARPSQVPLHHAQRRSIPGDAERLQTLGLQSGLSPCLHPLGARRFRRSREPSIWRI